MKIIAAVGLGLFGLAFAATSALRSQRGAERGGQADPAEDPAATDERQPRPAGRVAPPVSAGFSALAAAAAQKERIPAAGELSWLQQQMTAQDEAPERRQAARAIFLNLKIAVEREVGRCWSTPVEPRVRLQVGLVAEAANGGLALRDARVQDVLAGRLEAATLGCVADKLQRLTRLEGPTGPLSIMGPFRAGLRVDVQSPCPTCFRSEDIARALVLSVSVAE